MSKGDNLNLNSDTPVLDEMLLLYNLKYSFQNKTNAMLILFN